MVVTAAIILIVLALCALAAEIIAPYDPLAQNLLMRNQPPMTPGVEDGSPPHILGTDPLGRDVLSRIIFGARVSILVVTLTVLISGTFGVAVGTLAGYFGGRLDTVVMRFIDLQMSLPFLLIALLILFVLGSGFWNVILVLAVVKWMIYARVSRGLVLAQREAMHIDAVRAIGVGNVRILTRHILPSVAAPLMVLATLEAASIIIGEAALSFLGFGVQPPTPSWGSMLADGRAYITTAWWIIVVPGLAIFLMALSLNLFANWIRVVSDPTGRTGLLARSRARGRRVAQASEQPQVASEVDGSNRGGEPDER